ncbi:MAG TPA: hypothetical protein VFT43_04395 [Candidatus Polarisedimenticolia bacterium]|nr:hypothetical protein [Candidatus Polarisedimenticolia bacterium]
MNLQDRTPPPSLTRRAAWALLALLLASGLFVAGRASADQPHMQAALRHLRMAQEQLDKAAADKGGHRAVAIKLVNEAIAEVEKGVEFDRTH